MATHSSILAWEIPWTEEPGGLQSMGWERDMIEGLSTHVQACARARVCAHTHTHTHHIFILAHFTHEGTETVRH